jgi:rhamnulokinase
LIEPNDPAFSDHGDMPARVRAFCAHTGQPEPVEPGAVVRCILESLALKHAQTIDVLASVTGTEPEEIHLVGGGSRNELLCRWTASAAGLPVLAGPEEATLLGNFLVQAMSLGELASIDDGRAIVRASFAPTIYEPEDRALWREARERFARAVALPTLGVSA